MSNNNMTEIVYQLIDHAFTKCQLQTPFCKINMLSVMHSVQQPAKIYKFLLKIQH